MAGLSLAFCAYIAGGGRIGYQIASIFKKLEHPFLILEQDFRRFEKSKHAGFPVIYGDASQETGLYAANLKKAKPVIVTIPFISTAIEIIKYTRKINPRVKIIARADELAV